MSEKPATAPVLPGSLKANPHLGQWLRFDPSGYIELCPGKVEIGQGIVTALTQIAAEELDVDPARIHLKAPTTAESPNEGVTSGSLSIQDSGSAIRHASAQARAIYLAQAADKLGVSTSLLRVEDGAIAGPDNLSTSYWELADDALLDCDAALDVSKKPAGARTISGSSMPRLDIPEKILGEPRFIHDRLQAGVLHGRVLRPPSPAATLKTFSDTRANEVSGIVAIVHDGNYIGAIAETEYAANKAIERLRSDCIWDEQPTLPDEYHLGQWLRTAPAESSVVASRETRAPESTARTVRRDFTRPFVAHASIGLCCAVAEWTEGKVRVWTHCQGIYNLRADLALVFGLKAEDVVVEHMEGAGCYGHNGADDVALDAALLARAVPGKSVRVLWSREEELAWAPHSPGMAITIEADLDDRGEIIDWRHQVWSNGHATRPGRGDNPTLLSAYYLENAFPRVVAGNMPLQTGGGADRNAVPAYNFPNFSVTNHRLLEMPLRTSALRSLGATANVFAIESMMDELAHEAGEDPVDFRLRHLDDPRARAVVETAAKRAGWANRQKREGTGYGVGYAKYKNLASWCAAIAEIEADKDIRVKRLTIAVDAGEVINPDGLANQIEGGAIQTVSWVLKEAVRFDDTRVTSIDWETYPILTFSEVPAVDIEIINRPDERALGAGEAPHGPVAGAIVNAIHDALGVRVYDLPLTFDRIVKAVQDS
ncbi:MAG: xanthine dehydrogenase family protein molybdopterin-binding subunit [Hyphomicrobiales bacterium]|nr:xanthine dehydrogenase family protein molybdopterin-binding subunit [Hyphomicrobiales bacterium]